MAERGSDVSPLLAAVATLQANRRTLWLARVFGRRVTRVEAAGIVTMRRWRGKLYFTDFSRTKGG